MWTATRAAALFAVAVSFAPTSLAAPSLNQASTDAFVRALHHLAAGLAAGTPAATRRFEALARIMESECHGILAHAPGLQGERDSVPQQSARRQGEQARAEHQLSTIGQETEDVVSSNPARAPIVETFAKTVEALSWSDPRITSAVHRDGQGEALYARRAPPDACADMKAWAASGFKKLSPASRALRTEEESPIREIESEDAPTEPIISPGELRKLLRPYETVFDRRLLKEASAVLVRVNRATLTFVATLSRLNLALGFPQTAEEQAESKPPIATGNAETGERFEVRLVPKEEVEAGCNAEVSIQIAPAVEHGLATFGSRSSECISHNHRGQPASSCEGGIVGIHLAVAPSVRNVRLRLSNGRVITSTVVLIPRRYGGPRGIYIQRIRGYEPHPVSLTEVQADGRVLRVLDLDHAPICHKTPSPKAPHPVLPFSIQLARGTTPGGQHFTIAGNVIHFRGETEFNLEAQPGQKVAPEEELQLGTPKQSPAFSFSVLSECEPHPYAILYGILAAPGASVQVRTDAGLVGLTKVDVAANLNSGGPLFYGSFTSLPSELIVERSDGSTLYSESLVPRETELSKFCEGYVEG